MIPDENRQYFGDEINRGGLVMPRVLVYTMCAFAWDTNLQIMKNYQAKSLFLSSKMHRSIFLSGQAIESMWKF